MKTKEELNAIKNEVETMSRKLAQLNEEELSQVSGGVSPDDIFKMESSPVELPVLHGQQNHIESFDRLTITKYDS